MDRFLQFYAAIGMALVILVAAVAYYACIGRPKKMNEQGRQCVVFPSKPLRYFAYRSEERQPRKKNRLFGYTAFGAPRRRELA